MDQMHMVIELCKRLGSTVGFYMLQVDFFAQYEALFGAQKALQLLSGVLGTIHKVFSRSTDVICHYTEDTFTICSSVSSARDAHDMAKLLRASIEKLNIPAANPEVYPVVTASVGYTLYTGQRNQSEQDEDMDVFSFLEESEDALTAARFSGRNTEYSFIPMVKQPVELEISDASIG